MEHQYPTAISGDEQMLAELMLPDQAHARKEDWTIFFLHKDIGEGEEGLDSQNLPDPSLPNVHQENGETGDNDGANEEQDVEGGEGPPLIYVLNLVNTKHDSNAKRFVAFLSLSLDEKTKPSQRRCCESNGHLYTTFISAHIQSQLTRWIDTG